MAVIACLALALAGGAAAQAPKTTPAKKAAPNPTDLKSLGTKSAPITMEVFSDYQCPACRDLYLLTVRQVIENYVSAGKVYLVHRDFPLPIHQYSRLASRYANAAAQFRKMDRVVKALYEKQDVWSVDGNVDAVVAAVLTPSEMRRVRTQVNDKTHDSVIDADLSLGKQYRVNQTPTTIITHKGQTYPIVGVMSYSILRQFLDSLLGK
jgi:protein-disulfide isomerase